MVISAAAVLISETSLFVSSGIELNSLGMRRDRYGSYRGPEKWLESAEAAVVELRQKFNAMSVAKKVDYDGWGSPVVPW